MGSGARGVRVVDEVNRVPQAKSAKVGKVKVTPYAAHQTIEAEPGKAYRLTFVRGTDTRTPATYKAEDGHTARVPEDLLSGYRGKVNFFKVQDYTAVHLVAEGVDVWGVGFCSHSEPEGSSRSKGQRRALTLALKQSNIARPTRTALWQAYNTQNPLPKLRRRSASRDIHEVTELLSLGAHTLVQVNRAVQRHLRRANPEARVAVEAMMALIGR
jgi:hypothetical protein